MRFARRERAERLDLLPNQGLGDTSISIHNPITGSIAVGDTGRVTDTHRKPLISVAETVSIRSLVVGLSRGKELPRGILQSHE